VDKPNDLLDAYDKDGGFTDETRARAKGLVTDYEGAFVALSGYGKIICGIFGGG
jgi:hypothetical protein